MSKHSSDLLLCSALLTSIDFFLLGRFHCLFAGLLGRYPMTLTSLIPCVFKATQASIPQLYTMSSRLLFRDMPDTCLASAAWWDAGGHGAGGVAETPTSCR